MQLNCSCTRKEPVGVTLRNRIVVSPKKIRCITKLSNKSLTEGNSIFGLWSFAYSTFLPSD